VADLDEPIQYARSMRHLEFLENKALEALEAEAAAEEDEDDEEEDEDEEGDGGEGEGGDEDEEDDYGEEEEADPSAAVFGKVLLDTKPGDNKYLNDHEKIRSKFNEVEVEAFMKLLDIKPTRDWKDESVYHWSAGMHAY
jgi:hypothetical protein